MSRYEAKYYDGEVRYWDVYRQQWQTATTVEDIPDAVYASFSREEREAIIEHLDGVPVVRP